MINFESKTRFYRSTSMSINNTPTRHPNILPKFGWDYNKIHINEIPEILTSKSLQHKTYEQARNNLPTG